MGRLSPLLILVAALAVGSAPARADWVRGQGEQVFGRDTSEAEACRVAEERAREAALKARLGERVAAEDLMTCSEHGAEAECSVNRSVWSMVDGDIRATRNLAVATSDGPAAGFRACTVSLEADVGVAIGQPDPGFDLAVRLNAQVFRPGEDLTIALEPTRAMHVAVFQWLPYQSGSAQVSRLFPNPLDADGRVAGPATVPSAAGAHRYALKLAFPDGQPAARRVVDEYLMVVATKSRIDFRDSYSFDEFRTRLLEIPRSDSRLVKRGYSVVRAP